jgi:(1->4)-alpha-D-glucan 1-alpha-D-glucosylmutase
MAFARQTADDAAIVVVPRLTSALVADPAVPPIGEAVWSSTRITLPDSLRDHPWINALTRELVSAPPSGALPLSQLLTTLPVALLVSKK